MRVAVTGATGLVGTAVLLELRTRGHEAIPLKRGAGDNSWNVDTGEIRTTSTLDALIHLAGRSVAARWTKNVRREIWDSRVPATEKLAAFLARLPAGHRPRALIAASAIGIYGDRGDEVLTESSPVEERPGKSFLADVCRRWEQATTPAEQAGIRVVHARISVVLAKKGGALAKLRGPVKWGLGGPIGNGTQWMPWVSLRDTARILVAMAEDDTLRGPVNITAGAVRQHEFIRTLGTVLHRPTVFPMPRLMVKLAFGRMGVEMLLASLRVVARQKPAGFEFKDTNLAAAMAAELGMTP